MATHDDSDHPLLVGDEEDDGDWVLKKRRRKKRKKRGNHKRVERGRGGEMSMKIESETKVAKNAKG